MTFFPNDRVMLRAGKLRGAHLAIVVENKDSDGNPGYRVKVIYPWLNDLEKSYWARIAVPMSGPERGTYFLPETDDQVLVVFEHGDINRPIVIGTLWSKKQQPVEVNDSGKNNTKLIKSRSGHRVIFDDTEGAEKVTVVDKTRKNKIVLDSVNKIVAIESDGDIVLKSAANVIIHSNALKIGTSGNLIGKGQKVLAHATSTFGIKTSGRMVVDGSSVTINVNNSPAAQVSGSGAGFLGSTGAEVARDQVAEQLRSSDSTSSSSGDPAPRNVDASPVQTSPDLTFVEVNLVDTDEKPVPFASYRVTASDGTVFSGWLDIDGHARIDGVAVGICKVTFPEFHGDDWSIV